MINRFTKERLQTYYNHIFLYANNNANLHLKKRENVANCFDKNHIEMKLDEFVTSFGARALSRTVVESLCRFSCSTK